jgi:NAD+ kinase
VLVSVVANMYRPGIERALKTLADWSASGSHKIVYEEALADLVGAGVQTCAPEEVSRDADMIVALGGDGTMLRAARLVGRAGVPVLGVNLGSLGFLTQVTPKHLDSVLSRLAKGDYQTEARSVLAVLTHDGSDPLYAFNEVTIDRGQQTRAIELKLEANHNLVCWYVADGLIVATPTGSTAYALSAGGPVAMPELRAFIVAPVAAHTLAQRPIVIPDDVLLRVTNEEPNVSAFVNVDGRASAELVSGGACEIRKADFSLQLVRFPEEDFFGLVRAKLGWGMDPRHAHRDGRVV